MREQLLRQVEAGLHAALEASRLAGLGRDQIVEILDGLIHAEQHDMIQ